MGLYGHCKRACTESWLWDKKQNKNLPYRGIGPASQTCWSNALATELHPQKSQEKTTTSGNYSQPWQQSFISHSLFISVNTPQQVTQLAALLHLLHGAKNEYPLISVWMLHIQWTQHMHQPPLLMHTKVTRRSMYMILFMHTVTELPEENTYSKDVVSSFTFLMLLWPGNRHELVKFK